MPWHRKQRNAEQPVRGSPASRRKSDITGVWPQARNAPISDIVGASLRSTHRAALPPSPMEGNKLNGVRPRRENFSQSFRMKEVLLTQFARRHVPC